MQHRQIDIEEYNYPLPEAQIAAYPLARGESKLLIYKDKEIKESQYKSIDQFIPEGAWMVFNETKVVQARLLFPKNENTLIEIFCLEPLTHRSIEEAMQAQGSIKYKCLVGGARKWKDHPLQISLAELKLNARKISRMGAEFEVELSWDTEHSFSEVLEIAGKTPLPPYIKRQAEEKDKTSYQTSYAKKSGSVAAPTAGLHFNEEIFENLRKRAIQLNFLTLHVGAGTFKPVGDSVAEHEMHAEELFLDRQFVIALGKALKEKRHIIPVGTTSLRALESLYWLGCLAKAGEIKAGEISIPQWLGFENSEIAFEPEAAMQALLELLDKRQCDWMPFKTQIIIAPGYKHRIINALVTNFHQPKSTLMLLVASLIDTQWKDVYNYALSHDFRFLSYGDGCLIFKK